MTDVVVIDGNEWERWKHELIEAVSQRIRDCLVEPREEAAVSREKMADLLGIGIATLDRRVANDEIPSHRIGSRRMFFPSEVAAAIKVKSQITDQEN